MGRLEGKIALITGGGDGMGASHCKLFAQEGARLVVTDRREEPGQRVVDEIVASGGEAIFVGQDVASEADWHNVAAATMEKYGKTDILVNNAAIASFKSAKDATLEEWNLIMDVCAKSIFLGCKIMLPAMQAAGGGSIVNISSISGIAGMPNQAAYQAGKGAVRVLSKSIAVDYAKYNIRCNSVHPGAVRTRGTSRVMQDPGFIDAILTNTILGRVAEPVELSYPVLFLASDESSFVNGAEVVVDGGYTAK